MARDEGSGSGARALIFLFVSVIAGVAALYVVYTLIGGYQAKIQEASKPEATVMAIVAARDLYQGITITEEDLFAVEIPPDYLHEDVYQSPEHVVGRIPRERILANEFIREERLADADEGIGLNAIIPRGMRAVSINVEGGSAVSGFLNPGNYVDLLVTLDPEKSGRGSDTTTKTLLQAVYVLAVNSRLGTGAKRRDGTEEPPARSSRRFRPSVTLAVTPDQAEQVAHAEKKGTITLALRNDLDVGFAPVEGTTARDVLGEKDPVKPRPRPRPKEPEPEPEAATIQIIRGSTTEEHVVESPQ
ncbi:MAG: Flp pilus assembly protein CpaB [Deltaproteobacteria bacterium]|nr:Flp pilus assembly protein CpaB [Deltaproteobacteria bacterium]